MAQEAPARAKIPTTGAQRGRTVLRRAAEGRPHGTRQGPRERDRARGHQGGGPVIELECGVTVYPARGDGDRWRAVWYENGQRRPCEAASGEKLAARLEKVTERLEADAPNMTLRGADLIAYYLSPGRLPVRGQWSRKHAHTQRSLDPPDLAAVVRCRRERGSDRLITSRAFT